MRTFLKILFGLITIIGIIFTGNMILYSHSYPYACWRVAHPFGPDQYAYSNVIRMTTPEKIPYLMNRLDSSDDWWIRELLLCWFIYKDSETEGDRIKAIKAKAWNKKQWMEWWSKNSRNYRQLVLNVDPQL